MNPRLKSILEWYKNESKASERMIKAIPIDKLGKKIHAKFRTAGELGMHMGNAVRDLTAMIKSGKLIMSESGDVLPTTDAVAQHYKEAAEELLKAGKKFTESQLKKKIRFEINGKVIWEPTGYELLRGYMCHEIHHRAQIGAVLRLLDARVPGMYGPTADDV